MPGNDTGIKKLADTIRETEIISNFQMLKEIEAEPDVESIGASSFPCLTRMIEGFVPGEVVVVTGAFGSGKTLFCQSLTKDFSDDNEVALWFSYEVGTRFFLKRFPMNGVTLQFYMPRELVPYSIEFITGMTKKGCDKVGVNIVFIDHLHYVFDIERSKNVSIDIGKTVRDLKRMAVDLNLVVFLICHTNKAKIDNQVDMGLHLLRDSGLIACEADTGIFVWHNTTDEGGISTTESIIKICKARRTGVMNKAIPIIKEGHYLRETDQ